MKLRKEFRNLALAMQEEFDREVDFRKEEKNATPPTISSVDMVLEFILKDSSWWMVGDEKRYFDTRMVVHKTINNSKLKGIKK